MKEFTSTICTSKEQSKKLLELGLKPETADMVWHHKNSRSKLMEWELQPHRPVTKKTTSFRIEKLASPFHKHKDGTPMTGEEVFNSIWGQDIPTWSLSRLLELLPKGNYVNISINNFTVHYADIEKIKTYHITPDYKKGENIFDSLISVIERLVSIGKFDKEFLNQEQP